MKKYVILDGDNFSFKYRGRFVVNAENVNFAIIFLAILAALFLWSTIRMSVKADNRIEALESQYQYRIDSLNLLIDNIKTTNEINNLHKEIGLNHIKQHDFSKPRRDEVWNYILSLDTWYPEVIMAQAIMESGCGNRMPASSNNMFGMTCPYKRETTAMNAGSGDGFATYKNWKLGVIDRVLWELFYFDNKKPSEVDYYQALSGYAEDPDYIEKIRNVAQKYKTKK